MCCGKESRNHKMKLVATRRAKKPQWFKDAKEPISQSIITTRKGHRWVEEFLKTASRKCFFLEFDLF
jgi:hypothetical protein